MNEIVSKPKVVVIVGPTASGKTTLSIHIAKQFDGEIVSADSRQVYRDLDLGTGKVTEEEMQGVPHHMLDVADPMKIYTAADFVRDGRTAIDEILKKNKLPIIAGGSFFYIDSLLGRIDTPDVPPNPALRTELEKMSTDSLYNALLQHDPRRAEEIDPQNKQRLIRALEITEALGRVPEQHAESIYDVLTIGIDIDKESLHANIRKRIDERIATGMIEEVETLHERGMSYERMEALGLEYRCIARFLQEKISKDEMLTELDTKTRQFAKRQLTWLRRDKAIKWFRLNEQTAVCETISGFLAR